GRAQRGGEPRRAAGRQRVVRAGQVVAHRHRSVVSDEHRRGARNAGNGGGGIAQQELQVLRSQLVGERQRLVQIAGDDGRAVRAKRLGGDRVGVCSELAL